MSLRGCRASPTPLTPLPFEPSTELPSPNDAAELICAAERAEDQLRMGPKADCYLFSSVPAHLRVAVELQCPGSCLQVIAERKPEAGFCRSRSVLSGSLCGEKRIASYTLLLDRKLKTPNSTLSLSRRSFALLLGAELRIRLLHPPFHLPPPDSSAPGRNTTRLPMRLLNLATLPFLSKLPFLLLYHKTPRCRTAKR